MSRFRILLLALLMALGVVAAPPAQAYTGIPMPTRPGATMRIISPGNHYLGTTAINGRTVRVYVYAGRVVLRSTHIQMLRAYTEVLPSTVKCWSVHNEYWYGFSWSKSGSYNQDNYWCGNGTTISSQNQKVYAWVSLTDRALSTLVYEGTQEKTSIEFYGGWAWQEYAQGKFDACPIVRFACFAARYPRLATNVYANGHTDLWWHS